MNYNDYNEYQTPKVDILLLYPEGLLCASGDTDDYVVDDPLMW